MDESADGGASRLRKRSRKAEAADEDLPAPEELAADAAALRRQREQQQQPRRMQEARAAAPVPAGRKPRKPSREQIDDSPPSAEPPEAQLAPRVGNLDGSAGIVVPPQLLSGVHTAAQSLARCLRGPLVRRWVRAEFLYAGVDRGFFLRNEFVEFLAELGIAHVTQLTVAEWAAVRGRIGRPRVLSATFLRQERAKLERYRMDVRRVQQNLPPKMSIGDGNFVYQCPLPLAPAQRVTAAHPHPPAGRSGRHLLCTGTVLQADVRAGSYTLRFDRAGDGAVRVADSDIFPHADLDLLYPSLTALPLRAAAAAAAAAGAGAGAGAGASAGAGVGAPGDGQATTFVPHDPWRLGADPGPNLLHQLSCNVPARAFCATPQAAAKAAALAAALAPGGAAALGGARGGALGALTKKHRSLSASSAGLGLGLGHGHGHGHGLGIGLGLDLGGGGGGGGDGGASFVSSTAASVAGDRDSVAGADGDEAGAGTGSGSGPGSFDAAPGPGLGGLGTTGAGGLAVAPQGRGSMLELRDCRPLAVADPAALPAAPLLLGRGLPAPAAAAAAAAVAAGSSSSASLPPPERVPSDALAMCSLAPRAPAFAALGQPVRVSFSAEADIVLRAFAALLPALAAPAAVAAAAEDEAEGGAVGSSGEGAGAGAGAGTASAAIVVAASLSAQQLQQSQMQQQQRFRLGLDHGTGQDDGGGGGRGGRGALEQGGLSASSSSSSASSTAGPRAPASASAASSVSTSAREGQFLGLGPGLGAAALRRFGGLSALPPGMVIAQAHAASAGTAAHALPLLPLRSLGPATAAVVAFAAHCASTLSAARADELRASVQLGRLLAHKARLLRLLQARADAKDRAGAAPSGPGDAPLALSLSLALPLAPSTSATASPSLQWLLDELRAANLSIDTHLRALRRLGRAQVRATDGASAALAASGLTAPLVPRPAAMPPLPPPGARGGAGAVALSSQQQQQQQQQRSLEQQQRQQQQQLERDASSPFVAVALSAASLLAADPAAAGAATNALLHAQAAERLDGVRLRCGHKASRALTDAVRGDCVRAATASGDSGALDAEAAQAASARAGGSGLPAALRAAISLLLAVQSASDPGCSLSALEGFVAVQRALQAVAPVHAANAQLFGDLVAATAVVRVFGSGL